MKTVQKPQFDDLFARRINQIGGILKDQITTSDNNDEHLTPELISKAVAYLTGAVSAFESAHLALLDRPKPSDIGEFTLDVAPAAKPRQPRARKTAETEVTITAAPAPLPASLDKTPEQIAAEQAPLVVRTLEARPEEIAVAVEIPTLVQPTNVVTLPMTQPAPVETPMVAAPVAVFDLDLAAQATVTPTPATVEPAQAPVPAEAVAGADELEEMLRKMIA